MASPLCVLIFVCCLVATLDASVPTVKVSEGTLAGTTLLTRFGRQIFGFLGIPYAAPPIGRLRFKSPQPTPKWKGLRNASVDGNICSQQYVIIENIRNITLGVEDCLYLNVFTPEIQSAKRLPVMVYIHGGGYSGGSGVSQTYGPDMLLDKDIVLVTMNYRLGPLGFLSTGDSVLPGNLGLKDQLAALRWVQKNIHNFGGDKNSVTLFGESAGAASVHLHMLSPRSKGLFNQAIAHSSSALNPWAFGNPAWNRRVAEQLSNFTNCPFTSSQALHDCLMTLPAENITNTLQYFIEWDMDPVVQFVPTAEPEDVEDAFITTDPWTMTSDIPLFIGFNLDEGGLKATSITQGDVPSKFKQLNEDFKYLMPMSLMYEYTAQDVDKITAEIRQYYYGNAANITLEMVPELTKLYSDAWYNYGILETARRHSGPIFLYHFVYRGAISLCSKYFDSPIRIGVCHFDELLNLFPMDGYAPKLNFSDPDFLMSLKMVQLWTNFAQNKTPRLDEQEFWHSGRGSVQDYLEISADGLSVKQNLIAERDMFWQSLPYRHKPPVTHKNNLLPNC